jgi:hypothetical protein
LLIGLMFAGDSTYLVASLLNGHLVVSPPVAAGVVDQVG